MKERCVVGLLYGTGMRISEVCNLKITDIDSSNQRIKVVQGKGGKDRFTLLPNTLLTQLRAYYLTTNRPKEFLRRFEQHILPKGFVKIRHSGFLSHQNKGKRLASICEQLKISPPPPKVQLPVQVLAAMTYGTDITQCSVCKIGKLEHIASYVNIAKEGVKLVNTKDLNNRGSPRKIFRGV